MPLPTTRREGVALVKMGSLQSSVDEFYTVVRNGVMYGQFKSWADAQHEFGRGEDAVRACGRAVQ